jgi:hypothetical protein
MRRADVFVVHAFGYLCGVGQNALAFVAQRKIYRSRDLLADRRVVFNLLANRFHCGVGAQEPVGQCLIFVEQTQKQMFRLNIRAAELARLITGEEDGSPGLFGVALELISALYSKMVADGAKLIEARAVSG